MDFKLTDSLLEPFTTRRPGFGLNGLGLLTHQRTYSRLKDNRRNEKWWETVRCVVGGS